MTVSELVKYQGKVVRWQPPGISAISIDVQIMDIKEAYGSVRFLIQPVAGSGQQWVDETRITLGE